MCGILALIHTGRSVSREVLRSALDALGHRGPDDSGIWLDPSAGVALGHTRLAVLDLSQSGHQPMVSASGRFVIAFNGEIYNHLTLRQKIDPEIASAAASACPPPSGRPWRGHSDTETLLACIEQWGLATTLDRISGMFAFALWDRQDGILHLARDRMGEKPLYHGYVDGAFAAASEVEALTRLPGFHGRIDRGALSLLMRYGSISAPYCIYEGLAKVSPGTLLSVSLADARHGHCPAPRPYWSAVDAACAGAADPLTFRDDADAADALEQRLRAAVRAQMLSDVPVGAFLSGGIDSSTVVALMQAESRALGAGPARTFSIGFHEAGYNEADTAQAVARHLGTRHTELYVTPAEFMAVIPRLPTLYSEPFADSSQVATFLVAQLARHHVTVALSGDAGDELFGGYNRHFVAATLWPRISRIPMPARRVAAGVLRGIAGERLNRAFAAVAPLLPGRLRIRLPGDKAAKLASVLDCRDGADLYRRLVSRWEPADIVQGDGEPDSVATRQWPAMPTMVEQLMLLDAIAYLPNDILVKVDRAAMSVGLETRIPFLDRDVVEFAWKLPLRYKLRNGQGKWLVRQVLHRYVPRQLVERPKMGFGVPIGEWLRGPLRDWAEGLLDATRLRNEGLFDPAPIRATWTAHLAGQRNFQDLLWPVLVFQDWFSSRAADTRSRRLLDSTNQGPYR